jgi:hypothetical protein
VVVGVRRSEREREGRKEREKTRVEELGQELVVDV